LRTPDDKTSERAMSLNAKRPYFPADIEPTIAVAEAARWERDNDNDVQPQPVLVVADKMAEARLMRSAYQRELVLRFANMIGGWLFSSRAPDATAKVRSDTRR
jgi:hypothetical protein